MPLWSTNVLVHEQGSYAYPKRLTAGTVMNIVGKLRAIFSAHGRVGKENPVSLPEENSYVIFTREELDGAMVLPRQAIPFQPGKMQSLIHICFPS